MNPEESAYIDTLVARLDEILEELGEHFDCIQILGTYINDDGSTSRVTRGKGNWYARQGVTREFLEMDAAQTTAFEIAKVMPKSEPPDDGESWKEL